MTATDTGVLRALDFPLDVPCEVPRDPDDDTGGLCGERSDVWLRCLTCGGHLALCGPHFDVLLDWITGEGGNRTISCVRCPGKVLLRDWWRLFETIERADGW